MGFTSLMLIALSPRSCPPAICSLRHGRQQLLDLPVPRKRLMTRTPRPRFPRLRRNMTLLPTQMMANLGVRPFPSADPTEEELSGAAEKLDTLGTLVAQYKKNPEFFFAPANFGALPTVWLQARLTIEFRPFLDKMAKILNLVAAGLLYTQTLVHTNAFTHRNFYTQTLLHTDAFTRRHFHTQRFLHTETFTQRLLYTQTLLHKETFTHRRFYTQTLLHTDAFTHKHFHTQRLLHIDTFTHRRFYTQTLSTHRNFYTQKLSHTEAFTHGDRTREIAILPQFLASNVHFVRKGCGGHLKIAIFTRFLTSNVHFVHIDSAGCVVYTNWANSFWSAVSCWVQMLISFCWFLVFVKDRASISAHSEKKCSYEHWEFIHCDVCQADPKYLLLSGWNNSSRKNNLIW